MPDTICKFCDKKIHTEFFTVTICDECCEKLKDTDYFDGPGEGGV